MSKENRVSDEQLAKLAYAASLSPHLAEQLAVFRELQSLRSKPVAGVEVKPLDWGKTSYGMPEVDTIVGVYRVFKHQDGGWAATLKTFNLVDPHGRKNFATEDAALAAVEADYRQRVVSALFLPAHESAAWQRLHPTQGWQWVSEEDIPHYRSSGQEIRPLYTSPQPTAVITEEMVERAAGAMWGELQGYGQYPWGHPAEPGSVLEADFHRARQKARAALTAALKEA